MILVDDVHSVLPFPVHSSHFLPHTGKESTQATPTMAGATELLGSLISLVSKSEIRYEGVLDSADMEQSTIALRNGEACALHSRPCQSRSAMPTAMRVHLMEHSVGVEGLSLEKLAQSTLHLPSKRSAVLRNRRAPRGRAAGPALATYIRIHRVQGCVPLGRRMWGVVASMERQ